MKRTITLILFIAASALIITSCEEKDDTTPTPPTTNHTVTINSSTTGLPLQFTSLKLTPTDSSSASLTYNFVLNPGSSISVKANLPKTTSYKIEVISATGVNVWWSSIVMDSNNGNTPIHLKSVGTSNYTDYCPNSYCLSIPPSGC